MVNGRSSIGEWRLLLCLATAAQLSGNHISAASRVHSEPVTGSLGGSGSRY